MATTITGWPQSLDYRVIYDDAGGVAVTSNACGTPVSLTSVILDNTEGTDERFLKIVDNTTASAANTEPDWILRAHSGERANYDFPGGLPCTVGISFWVTRNETTGDQTAPAVSSNGTVKTTITVLQLEG